MDTQAALLSFLDMLDLDEELIDTRLKRITDKSRNYSTQNLYDAIQLLQYKLLINERDSSDCDNEVAYEFAVKLIKDISTDTADLVAIFTALALKLDSVSLLSNSEHLIQQILSEIDFSKLNTKDEFEFAVLPRIILLLKVCGGVLDAVISSGKQLSLLHFQTPIENLVFCSKDEVSIYFITNTIPKLFNGVADYNILDTVWECIIKSENMEAALKVVSSLSDFYLPAPSNNEPIIYKSKIILKHDFWALVLFGLNSDDFSLRRIAVYLAKRAIDYIKHVNPIIELPIFEWPRSMSAVFQQQWKNYFILLDSLEEKQSNIVLPSLQLFDTINQIGQCWMHCAFKLGLKHDNSQVRLKCIEYRLKTKITHNDQAITLLEALDDLNFYDNQHDTEELKEKIAKIFDTETLTFVIQAIPQANMSPLPLYHVSDILANLDEHQTKIGRIDASDEIVDLFKVPCNVIAMRKAIHVNLLHFTGTFAKHYDWKSYANIVSSLHIDVNNIKQSNNAFIKLVKEGFLKKNTISEFYNHVLSNPANIKFGVLYLESHPEDINIVIDIVKLTINDIGNIVNRQYSNKTECLKEVIVLLKLFNNCMSRDSDIKGVINDLILKEFKALLMFVAGLLSSDDNIEIDDTNTLFEDLSIPNDNNLKEILLEIYKNAVTILKSAEAELGKVVIAMCIVKNLSKNAILINNHKHEMLDLKSLLALVQIFEAKNKDDAKSIGRLRSTFYEKHCETVNLFIKTSKVDSDIENLVIYIENIIETGGYGCLKWTLRLMNQIIDAILVAKVKFDANQFINRMWRDIEELKTNHQYPICMKEFVIFITQDALLEKAEYNNTVILYCTKLIEYGAVKNSPLFYLVEEMKKVDYVRHQHIVYVFSKLLLYCPVPRKDQRIADNLTGDILKNPMFSDACAGTDVHFNYEIQYSAVQILSSIKDDATLDTISKLLTAEIDTIFKSKVRYHGNSQIHRTLQTALQHLLLILMLKTKEPGVMMDWCLELLGKLPHQNSVRVCLEWLIALCLHLQKHPINEELLQKLVTKNVSLTSQFVILYWLLRNKITENTFSKEEYEFVLDTLLQHTMGQMFNVRLQCQYFATEIYKLNKPNPKYEYTVQIINKTLQDNVSDKNFLKLKADYFANKFDILRNLSPFFIYYTLPRICDVVTNEYIDLNYVRSVIKDVEFALKSNDGFWKGSAVEEEELGDSVERNNEEKVKEDLEMLGTIQKKYIPWNSMSDVNVYEPQKKRESPGDMIVVASLIDKLPNLGGLARTSEVFGVRKYVIDSLRHLRDRQFQGLSVSAERWLEVEEVRAGAELKQFVARMRAEGYAAVAAEQTSSSTKLQHFRFPKKTLLLLGHEKEGVPCDLLPLMDHCVEVPQQGCVRSLNVHVTAAIFLWEYARQQFL